MINRFEKFRSSYLEQYGIDPFYTYSISRLTWFKLYQKIKCYEEDAVHSYDTIQSGIRGGISSVLGGFQFKCVNN